MPDRILRDYSDSEKFDGFPGNPETLFTRLLTKVDDYGRFSRDPLKVRGDCYPRTDGLRANTVDAWLKELSDHRLILCYQVGTKDYLAIVNFRQRKRLPPPKPKFPPPPGQPLEFMPDDGDWRQLAADCGGSPPYAESGTGTNMGSVGDKAFTSKPSAEGGIGGKRAASAWRKMTAAELEIAGAAEAALNGGWAQDSRKWLDRITGNPGNAEKKIAPVKAEPDRVRRVFADVAQTAKEGEIRTTPAQFAEWLWTHKIK